MAIPGCAKCGEKAWTDDGRCKACNEFPTLGWQVADWIEARCAIPDRDQVGEPFLLTDRQLRYVLHHYRVRPDARIDREASNRVGRDVWRNAWYYSRGSQLVGPQKSGKGPFLGSIICNEAAGPAVFDGWDAKGQPVGRPWETPIIQITALSEDQTDNVWMALLPMIQLGDFQADIPETGKLRIYLPGGGFIEPVTAAAKSRLGQRVTFVGQDQTESWWKQNGGRALADTQRRNVGGMGGRWVSTCNAWDPNEDSVAQYTAEHEVKLGGVYHDDIEPPARLSFRNKTERRKALEIVYADSYWVDLDRVEEEIVAVMDRDLAQMERFFGNRKSAGDDVAFNPETVDARASEHEVPEKALIVLGVDGARFEDAISVIATEVETGFQWPIGIWERPDNAPSDYEHPVAEIDGAVTEAFETYTVWRAYVDKQHIEHLLEKWQGRWGDKRVLPWLTSRPRQMAFAVRAFSNAVAAGDWSHNGDKTFVQHLKNARRRPVAVLDDERRQMHILDKDRKGSRNKIDGASGAVLSWECRGDAIAAGATVEPEYRVAGFR